VLKLVFALLPVLGLLATAPAAAQEQKTTPGEIAKPLLDNDRVRVLELNIRPGVKRPAGTHPPHLMYLLTDGTLVFSEEGKRPYEMIFRAGEAVWVPAQARAENESEKEVRAVIVEVKQTAAATAKGKRKPVKRRPAPQAAAKK
jgi:quercetin dioxygenase-like cupin family protein